MIAVSSFRAFDRCTEEIKRNQIAARRSWENAFERIIYFGMPEPELAGDKVAFIPINYKPPIRQMAGQCACQPKWSCIINADVILGPGWAHVEAELDRYRVDCAVSRRYQLGPDGNQKDAKLVDYGLDFFAARSAIWQAAVHRVPPEFTLGRILWDTWMLSFFMAESRGNCADITPARVIFHPLHGSREDQGLTPPKGAKKELDRVVWPGFQIGGDWSLRPLPHFKTNAGGGGILRG